MNKQRESDPMQGKIPFTVLLICIALKEPWSASKPMLLSTKNADETCAGEDHRGDSRIRNDAGLSQYQVLFENWLPGEFRFIQLQNAVFGKQASGRPSELEGCRGYQGHEEGQLPTALKLHQ
jgi:hypothetical protein